MVEDNANSLTYKIRGPLASREAGENSDGAPDEGYREQEQGTAAGGDGPMNGAAAADLSRERSATESDPDTHPFIPTPAKANWW